MVKQWPVKTKVHSGQIIFMFPLYLPHKNGKKSRGQQYLNADFFFF